MDQKQKPTTQSKDTKTITCYGGNHRCEGGMIPWGDALYECDDCAIRDRLLGKTKAK